MTARPFQILAILSILVTATAHAAAPDCVYRGEDVLSCDGNIIVPAGTYVTHDEPIVLMTSKAVTFGDAKAGVTVVCAEAGEAAPADATCGKFEVWANGLYGSLDVRATADGREAGPIRVIAGGYDEQFKMKLDTERDRLFVQLAGRDHTDQDRTLRWASR